MKIYDVLILVFEKISYGASRKVTIFITSFWFCNNQQINQNAIGAELLVLRRHLLKDFSPELYYRTKDICKREIVDNSTVW